MEKITTALIATFTTWQPYALVVFTSIVAYAVWLIKKVHNSASKKEVEAQIGKCLMDANKYTDRIKEVQDREFSEMKETNRKTYEMVLFLYQEEVKKKKINKNREEE
jgi:hypothetical protein